MRERGRPIIDYNVLESKKYYYNFIYLNRLLANNNNNDGYNSYNNRCSL